MQSAGAILRVSSRVAAIHIDDGLARERAPGTLNRDIGLRRCAVTQLSISVISPGVELSIGLNGIGSGVTFTSKAGSNHIAQNRHLHELVALRRVSQTQLAISVVAGGVERAICAQRHDAAIPLNSAGHDDIDDGLAKN